MPSQQGVNKWVSYFSRHSIMYLEVILYWSRQNDVGLGGSKDGSKKDSAQEIYGALEKKTG